MAKKVNPKSILNLKPFKKGEAKNDPNRNNKGQPKKLPHLDKLLAEVLGEEKDGIDAAKAILMALRAKATKGDIRAAEVLLDRAYGKAKQYIESSVEIKPTEISLTNLTKDELIALRELQRKCGISQS